jgi:amino acid transporter
MAVKRLKVTIIQLLGPVLLGATALISLQEGYTTLAAVAGVLAVITFIICAAAVRIVRKER